MGARGPGPDRGPAAARRLSRARAASPAFPVWTARPEADVRVVLGARAPSTRLADGQIARRTESGPRPHFRRRGPEGEVVAGGQGVSGARAQDSRSSMGTPPPHPPPAARSTGPRPRRHAPRLSGVDGERWCAQRWYGCSVTSTVPVMGSRADRTRHGTAASPAPRPVERRWRGWSGCSGAPGPEHPLAGTRQAERPYGHEPRRHPRQPSSGRRWRIA